MSWEGILSVMLDSRQIANYRGWRMAGDEVGNEVDDGVE